MLAINAIEYYVPEKRATLTELKESMRASAEMIKIFQLFFGLKEVAICDNLSIFDLLSMPLEKLLRNSVVNKDEVDYLVHTHTAMLVSPFGRSLVQEIKQKFSFNNAVGFGTSMYKCVSAIKMFDVFDILLAGDHKRSAIILSGEIAFTPELRLVPRSSISGDAAVVALVSNEGEDHKLLATEYRLERGYSRGIYLKDEEMHEFDSRFLDIMADTIKTAVSRAGLDLKDINLILPHNVNHSTWKNLAKVLRYPLKKVFTDNISHLGHCFSSDGLLNLVMAREKGCLNKGDYYLMAGCGMGFFFACAVFQY